MLSCSICCCLLVPPSHTCICESLAGGEIFRKHIGWLSQVRVVIVKIPLEQVKEYKEYKSRDTIHYQQHGCHTPQAPQLTLD